MVINGNISTPKRRTIGLLIEEIAGKGRYQNAIWSGIANTAQTKGVNLLCFVGREIKEQGGSEDNENIIYNLADKNNLDGLIISGSLATYITPPEFEEFCSRYKPLPMVTIGAQLPGIPSIIPDNEKGMQETIDHLIKEHTRSHIAFICGPKDYPDAQKRFQAYQKVLADNHLAYDPNLVVECKLFPENEGEKAIHILVERKVEFDAIIAGNDYLAIGAMKALKERNYKIPEEIVLIGFDDIEEAKANSLTTVRQQLHIQGKYAVETLLDLIAGKEVPEVLTLPMDLVKRESCGCNESEIYDTQVQGNAQKGRTIEQLFNAERTKVLSEIIKTIKNPRSTNSAEQVVDRLLNSFYQDLNDESSGLFLSTLDGILDQALLDNDEIDGIAWQKAISIIRREVLLCDCDSHTLKKGANIWHQARVKIAKAAQQLELGRRLQTERQAINLREIGEKLITTVEMHELMDILAQKLSTLEIPSCYIFLYDREFSKRGLFEPNELPEYSKLMLSYDNGDNKIYGKPGQFFKTNQLIADFIANRKELYSIVIEPLYGRDEQLGFIIFEMGPKKGIIYESLRGEINSSLEGALLVEEKQKVSEQLKRAQDTARLVAEVIINEDLDETLKAIAQGTMDVLRCDAVTLYPYDPTTAKLLSPATVGVWDQEKVSVKKGVIKEGSLVYQVFQKPEPFYIVEKTAEDSLFKERRFTREEMIKSFVGIRLETGDRKVGVMFVNYRKPHHFTDEELEDIKFYAHQAAAAIRNAQLRESAKRGKTYLEALYEAGQTVTSTLALDEILQSIADQAQKITEYYREPARFSEIVIIEKNDELQIKAIAPKGLFAKLMTRTSSYFNMWMNKERKGIIGRVANTGESELVNNVDIDADYKKCDPETHSELAVPIKISGQVIGVINIEHSQYDAFTYEDLHYLESLADQAAIAIRNAQTHNNLKRAQGIIAGRTALAWMGMASSAWRHSADKYALTIRETAQLLRQDGERNSWLTEDSKEYERISSIESLATQILEKPITPPLSSESKLEQISVNALIHERTKQLWQNEPYKMVDLKLNLQSSENLIIRANSEWLLRAFDMLVDNAIKAMVGSKVRKMIIGTSLEGNGCIISVSDSGCGIPKEIQDKIGLERIEKPEDAKGLGMGLLIAQTVVQTYDGNIRIASTGSEGTTMVIYLPLER